MSMRIKPALRYELRNFLMGCAPFFAILAVIALGSVVAEARWGADISFNAYGFACGVCLFIFGIVEPRPCLRLCAQFGTSRRTAFLSNITAALAASLLLAVLGEALTLVTRALSGGRLFMADLYQIVYLNHTVESNAALTLPQHLTGVVFNTLMMITAYGVGMFFTCLFWRLNKLWTVVVAIAIPVLLNAVPWLLLRLPNADAALVGLLDWLASSVWSLVLIFAIAAVLLSLFSWLLVFRANIKAPSGK